MEEQGYGRVLSRPGLVARERELITVAALAALGWERQLVSHLLGARRVGAGAQEVRAAYRTGLAVADRTGRAAAEKAWAQAGPRLESASPAGAR
jgi:4-carboxymuconolactone decarboxylase